MAEFTPAPSIRPRPCVGALMDIPSGRYHQGAYGDMILNGGFSNFIGVGGRGNTFKTTLAISVCMTVLYRHPESSMVMYDTEMTFEYARLDGIAQRYPGIDVYDEGGRIILTSAAEYSGNDWWANVREEHKERIKEAKKLKKDTPFLDAASKPMKAFPMRIHLLDSMSQLQTDAISDIYEKNQIDDSSATTDNLRSGGIKTRLIMQVPQITSSSGMSLVATAHVGDEFKLDPYAPSTKKLKFLKNGLQFKNVPEKFTFLSSNCWVVQSATPLVNKTTKAAEYPLEGFKDNTGDTDLQELEMINVRSKYGPTGHVIHLIVSQSEGLLPSLSEFHFLKSRKDKFGLQGPEGVHKDWRLAIYPDVLLKRTSVRKTIDEDPKLRRALEITTELCQIYEYWTEFPREDVVEPADLYERLKQMGYDWNVLLETRGYWTFDHYTNDISPLSTMDLINMYHGRYVPFWYPNKDKIKTDVAKSSGERDEQKQT